MYRYRKLIHQERIELVEARRAQGFPPHSPPHPQQGASYYFLTATCYEHCMHIHTDARRHQILDGIFEQTILHGIELQAWVVLPNHYHLLAYVPDFKDLGQCFRRVHGPTARQWNVEDDALGRKVWYRFTDRRIRSERHYYTTLNYIHYNPVKHGCTTSPYDWPNSSVMWYVEHYGKTWLRDLWVSYPLRAYGETWDTDQFALA
jgi:putative transposase